MQTYTIHDLDGVLDDEDHLTSRHALDRASLSILWRSRRWHITDQDGMTVATRGPR